MRNVLTNSPRLRAMIEVSEWALRDAGTSVDALLEFCWSAGLVVHWAERADDRAPYGVEGSVARPRGGIRANDVLCVARPNAMPAMVTHGS